MAQAALPPSLIFLIEPVAFGDKGVMVQFTIGAFECIFRHIKPSAGKVNANRNLERGSNLLDNGGGADGFERGFCFGKDNVGRANGFAEVSFDINVVFCDSKDVGFVRRKLS